MDVPEQASGGQLDHLISALERVRHERTALGKSVRQADARAVYGALRPLRHEMDQFRLKTHLEPLEEWLVDEVFSDLTKWNQQIGPGSYVLRAPWLYTLGGAFEFRIEGICVLPDATNRYVVPIDNLSWKHEIRITIKPLLKTRMDVSIEATGPEAISTFWDAYSYFVTTIASFSESVEPSEGVRESNSDRTVQQLSTVPATSDLRLTVNAERDARIARLRFDDTGKPIRTVKEVAHIVNEQMGEAIGYERVKQICRDMRPPTTYRLNDPT